MHFKQLSSAFLLHKFAIVINFCCRTLSRCSGRFGWGGVALVVALTSLLPVPCSQAQAPRGVSGDSWADLVLGHIDFNQAVPNDTAAYKVMNPGGVIVDRTVRPNHIYVYDGANSRVLGFRSVGFCDNSPLQACTSNSDCGGSNSKCVPTPHKPADIVFGQPADASGRPLEGYSGCNRDGNLENHPFRKQAAADTLCSTPETQNSPSEGGTFTSMAIDAQGNFYMTDPFNNRVLKFIRPFDTDTVADDVWGQQSFAGNRCNLADDDLRRGPMPLPSASTLCLGRDSTFVSGVDIDVRGNLWVADVGNNRVLRFPNVGGQIAKTADLVLGQPDFTTMTDGGGDGVHPEDNPNPTSFQLNKMHHPGAVRVSPLGKVFVADSLNNRVIVFSEPFSNGMTGRLFGSRFNSPNGVEFEPQGDGIWISDTNNYMLERWDAAGTAVTKVLFKDTYQPNGQCGSMTPNNSCSNPTSTGECFSNMCDARGSIGIDVDGNILVAASNFVQDMWRYLAPIPSPSLGIVYSSDLQFFRWPHPERNLRSAHSLFSPRGIAVKNDQVIVSDGNRVSFWNDPTSLTNGKDADGFVEASSFIGTNDPALQRLRADNQGHLWVLRGPEVDVYQLPLTSGAQAWRRSAIGVSAGSTWTLPVLGGGQITWTGETSFSGLDIDPTGQFLWLVQGSVPIHRVIRVRNPLTEPVVDVILGQPDPTSTFCNRDPNLTTYDSQGGTSDGLPPRGAKPNTLCRPGSVRLDGLGNVWVSDYSLEFHGNRRLLEFNASLFANNIGSTALFGPDANIVSAEIRGWEPAFDSENHMALGYDGQLWSYNGQSWTSPFPGLYANPYTAVTKRAQSGSPLSAPPDAQLSDFYSHGYSITFDDNDDLYVADLNRGRVLLYKAPTSTMPSIVVPVISNIAVQVLGGDSAQITWTTDRPSDSRVQYFKASAPGVIRTSSSDGALTTPHSVKLTGLTPNTVIKYRIMISENGSSSPDYAFTTPEVSIVRIDAGSSISFTDHNGNVWLPDGGIVGGAVVDRGNIAIANTLDPRLYQTEHYGMSAFTYSIPNGSYQVNLHFAETYSGITGAGQRVFGVNVEGTAIGNIDVFAEAGGARKALVKTVFVNVADGQLNLAFTPVVNNTEINGIEIIPGGTAPAVARVEAGGGANFTDHAGNTWLSDRGFTGGALVDRGNIAIGNTLDPRLYQTEHYGMTAFAYSVPNGSYVVNLFFAETYAGITGPGQRVFSVNVEGTPINNIDVFAEAGGARKALVKTVTVTVTDGRLNIGFTANANNPEINGIEIASAP